MEKKLIIEKIPFIISVLFVLFFIIKDCLKTYGKNKTIAFFLSGIIYSILRANFISWIMSLRHSTEPILPYEINLPIIKFFGTTPVEISGWLIASYLSYRISSYLLKGYNLFNKVFLSALFIASLSFAVETIAIESDWWRWRLVLGDSIFGRVPTMGIIDWAFVCFEFLLPFLLFTNKSPQLLKIFSVLIFPLHMFFHLCLKIISDSFPFTMNILFHLALAFIILSFGFIFKIKSNSETFPKIPFICNLIIILTLVSYFIYFKVQFEFILSTLPLIIFLTFHKRMINLIFLGIAFVFLFFSKLAIPSLILIFSFYFIKYNKKIYYLALPFLILISILYFEGKKTIEVNSAIEEFNVEYKKGNWETAYLKLKRSLELDERHPVGNLLMAEYYLKVKKDYKNAEFYYKKSLEYYKYFYDSFISLIQFYLDEGRSRDALALWKKGFSYHSEKPAILYLGYRIYKSMGEAVQAQKYLIRANEKSSIENFGKLHLYTILNLKGEEEAQRVAWQCLKERKNIQECLSFLWEFYNSKKDEEKLNELKSFIEKMR